MRRSVAASSSAAGGGADAVQAIAAGFFETVECAQTAVRPESRVERRIEQRGVAGRELTVGRTFGPGAVLTPAGEAVSDRIERAAKNFGGLLAGVVRDRQSAHRHGTVADHVPVETFARPPGLLLVVRQRLIETLGDQGVAHPAAFIRGERVVQPVVADRERERHLGRIDKARRIPVAEVGGRVQFHDRAAQPGIALREAVHQRQREDAVDGFARLLLQTRAVQLVLDRRDGEEAVALLFHIAVDAAGERVVADQRPETLQFGIGEQQTRVFGTQRAQGIFSAGLCPDGGSRGLAE